MADVSDVAAGDGARVRELGRQVVPAAEVTDLGGFTSDTLRLRAAGTDLVLRVHQRGISRRRVVAEQRLRARLASQGLVVAEALPVGRSTTGLIDGRVYELEPFLQHHRRRDGWGHHAWLFEQMASVHRATAGLELDLPRRRMTHFAQPSTLDRWLRLTAARVAGDPAACGVVDRSRAILTRARRMWPMDRDDTVSQIVHGDVKYDNVGISAAGRGVILDFGHAATRPRIHDLAFTLVHTVFTTYVPEALGIAPEDILWERVPALIGAYEAAAGWRLTPTERRWLAPYTATVPLFFPAMSFRHPDPCRAVHWRASMLPAAEWILDHPDALTG